MYKPGDTVIIIGNRRSDHLSQNSWVVPPIGTKVRVLKVLWSGPDNNIPLYLQVDGQHNLGRNYTYVDACNVGLKPKRTLNLPTWF